MITLEHVCLPPGLYSLRLNRVWEAPSPISGAQMIRFEFEHFSGLKVYEIVQPSVNPEHLNRILRGLGADTPVRAFDEKLLEGKHYWVNVRCERREHLTANDTRPRWYNTIVWEGGVNRAAHSNAGSTGIG